jgi:hypothetical protein
MRARKRLPNRRASTTFGFECNALRYLARSNVEFPVQVKELTLEQIHRLLDKGLNQFDDNVLRTELHWRHADTQDSTSPYYRGNRTTQDAITALLKLNNNRDRILALYEENRP